MLMSRVLQMRLAWKSRPQKLGLLLEYLAPIITTHTSPTCILHQTAHVSHVNRSSCKKGALIRTLACLDDGESSWETDKAQKAQPFKNKIEMRSCSRITKSSHHYACNLHERQIVLQCSSCATSCKSPLQAAKLLLGAHCPHCNKSLVLQKRLLKPHTPLPCRTHPQQDSRYTCTAG